MYIYEYIYIYICIYIYIYIYIFVNKLLIEKKPLILFYLVI